MVGRDADGLRDTFAAPEPEAQAAEEPAGRPVNPGGETRTPEQSPPGERGGNWPSYESLDLEKLKSARNISCDHPPADQKLNGFKPASKKPRHRELWQAVMERDATKQPKNWSVESCVRFLILPANKPATAAGPNGTGTGEPEAAAAAEDEDAGNKEDNAAAPRLHWSRNYLVCLLHVISSLPQEFMNCNRKLKRVELDANSKDAFWEKAAQVFNSKTEFHLIKPRSATSKTKFEKLCLSCTH